MSDIVNWIWFSSKRKLRFCLRQTLLEQLGDPGEIFKAKDKTLLACGANREEFQQLTDHELGEAKRIVDNCAKSDVQIITLQDAQYPQRLKNIDDPPYVLYIKGRLPDVDSEAAIAVVGTRSSTGYGDDMARELGYGITKGGGLVVTGLAQGNDSMAAEGAISAGGRVIGVLGTAIDEVFPKSNGPLFDRVRAGGALVSEYPPGTVGNRSFFPARNRIMAGLCVGVVVVEAPIRSGALITAHRALDYGRDVFAVPGNVNAPNSAGSNALIREGAKITTNAWDVLCEYEQRFPDRINRSEHLIPPDKPAARSAARGAEKQTRNCFPPTPEKSPRSDNLAEQLSGLNEEQLSIVRVMEKPSMHIDDIIDLARLPAPVVLAELTLLQIKGYVVQENGKRFTLKITKRG